MHIHDTAIVGAGPAGLNAALFLGRCGRDVVLIDAGRPRNARSRGVSGFLTRDGAAPFDLRRIGRAELERYETVSCRDAEVATATRNADGFELTLSGGETVLARKLILATGLLETMPDLPDVDLLYGRGVYPCPYCDGWEHRGEHLAALGTGAAGRGMAIELTAWSRDITLLTNGPAELSDGDRDLLARQGIDILEDRIAALDGRGEAPGLSTIRFETGRTLACGALFHAFDGCRQSPLVAQLGCDLNGKGAVETGGCESTNVPGLYVAGDASKRVKFAVVAAAEGAMAAFGVNTELLKDGVKQSARGSRSAA